MNKIKLTKEIVNDLVIGDIISNIILQENTFGSSVRISGHDYEILENIGNNLTVRCVYDNGTSGDPIQFDKNKLININEFYLIT